MRIAINGAEYSEEVRRDMLRCAAEKVLFRKALLDTSFENTNIEDAVNPASEKYILDRVIDAFDNIISENSRLPVLTVLEMAIEKLI